MLLSTFKAELKRKEKRQKAIFRFAASVGKFVFGSGNIGKGVTRFVGIRKDYVIKIPRFDNFDLFLSGWQNNRRETQMWKAVCYLEEIGKPQNKKLLCPIIKAFLFGLIVIMKKARILTQEEFDENKFMLQKSGVSYYSVEIRRDMFGMLENRIVCIDYGGESTVI